MAKIDWAYVQAASDDILADGLEALKSRPCQTAGDVRDAFPCTYLISLRGAPRYVGEAEDAQARLKQQFREASSTFYRAYLKRTGGGQRAAIGEFDVQVMRAELGRKEIERHVFLNLVEPLNRSRRQPAVPPEDFDRTGLWDIVQAQHDRLIEEGVAAVQAMLARPWFGIEPPPLPGVYLVKHKGKLIYVGESSDLAARHETHSEDTYFSALRRHIGTEMLGCELQDVGGRRRYFTDDQDWKVTRFLVDCEAVFLPVSLGRAELEAHLIATLQPLLNRTSVAVQTAA